MPAGGQQVVTRVGIGKGAQIEHLEEGKREEKARHEIAHGVLQRKAVCQRHAMACVVAELNEQARCEDVSQNQQQGAVGLQETCAPLICYVFSSTLRRFYMGWRLILIKKSGWKQLICSRSAHGSLERGQIGAWLGEHDLHRRQAHAHLLSMRRERFGDTANAGLAVQAGEGVGGGIHGFNT